MSEESAASRPGCVSVVIPAYNEEHGIQPVLEDLRKDLDATDIEYEILVVDDGSSDKTWESICEFAEPIKALRHEVNKGYGAALKTGIRKAKYPYICITDADGTYPNGRIPELLAHLDENDADMVVGSRTGLNVSIPLVRRPAKWVIGRLANYVAGRKIPDINSGLRVFKCGLARRMFHLLPEGFSFTTTITLAMMANGYSVAYMPIDYHARIGRSKIRPIRDTLNFLQLILRMALYFAPLKIFLAVAAFLLTAGVALALFSHYWLGKLADLSTLLLIMSAVQIAGLGLVAELINRRMPHTDKED
jgi:glycosyltransferase involved in cell wall biosynthesis